MKQELTVEDVMEIGAELRRQAIASATPAERLAGLAPEEMEELLKQIELLLAALTGRQANDKPHHRSRRER